MWGLNSSSNIPSTSNYPTTALAPSNSSGSFSGHHTNVDVSVQINAKYRISPPVPGPPAPPQGEAPPSTYLSVDFDLEHRILEELNQPQNGHPSPLPTNATTTTTTTTDPLFSHLLSTVHHSGCTEEELKIGISLCQRLNQSLDRQSILTMAEKYKSIRSVMEAHGRELVVGALARHGGNVEEAINCLSDINV